MCNSHQPPLVTRRSNKALPIPNVPVADPIDGLLTLEDLQQPVVLNLVVWPEAAVGHSYQLTWNSVLTGEKKYITTEQPGDALTLDIPPGLLASDGNYDAGYGAINEVGGQTAYSPEIPLIVDRTAPGGTLLAAMVFPVETHDGVLTSAELTALGDVLTTEVPGYTGMAWGDRIRTFWGDVVGPEHTVTTSEVNEDLVMLNFTRAFLESLGDVEEPAYFTVTDRAGNVSINSLSKTFKLFLQEIPQDYPAPVCVQADDGVIDDADARATVAVDIPQYPNAQVGDKVTLYWGSHPLPEVTLQAGDETSDPVFTLNVPYAAVALSGDGDVDLHYEVRRNELAVGSSLRLSVNVNLTLAGPQDPDPETPENEALDLPIIRGTSGNPNNEDNVIDEDDFLLEATAVIGWKDEFAISDRISLYWGSQTTPVVYTLRSSDIDRDLLLTIPNELMAAEGTGDAIKVAYTVTHAGNPNTSRSAAQNVIVRSQGELPGGPDGLLRPVFTNANQYNAISPVNSPDGTPVFIPAYINADKYPRVSVVFHGYNRANGDTPVPGGSVEFTHVLDEFEQVDGYSFRVTAQQLSLICEGRGEAYYRVEGPDGLMVNSPTTDVIITMAIPGQGC
ncbi:hypothetical protein BWR59_28030 [Pseudomonas sp. Bc-h]|uniref:hypothetical protein n=1 Tax=Pseudomonas sp. Bc-h TaxID=1943632 RepID=UPI0009D9B13F|nr:hypothetical protein [Pseudomonas sp. Bc-h]OQR27096.1 hypothetical protein BWR59_28030 [Pseudomonas sp. Bc-h]